MRRRLLRLLLAPGRAGMLRPSRSMQRGRTFKYAAFCPKSRQALAYPLLHTSTSPPRLLRPPPPPWLTGCPPLRSLRKAVSLPRLRMLSGCSRAHASDSHLQQLHARMRWPIRMGVHHLARLRMGPPHGQEEVPVAVGESLHASAASRTTAHTGNQVFYFAGRYTLLGVLVGIVVSLNVKS
jgi:hypothetical protein